jgi:hypothetical protein
MENILKITFQFTRIKKNKREKKEKAKQINFSLSESKSIAFSIKQHRQKLNSFI